MNYLLGSENWPAVSTSSFSADCKTFTCTRRKCGFVNYLIVNMFVRYNCNDVFTFSVYRTYNGIISDNNVFVANWLLTIISYASATAASVLIVMKTERIWQRESVFWWCSIVQLDELMVIAKTTWKYGQHHNDRHVVLHINSKEDSPLWWFMEHKFGPVRFRVWQPSSRKSTWSNWTQ